MIEPDVAPAQTRVLLALLTVHGRDGHATIQAVGEQAGLSSKSTVWFHLEHLRRLGLVAWEDGKRGTLRPLVQVVAHSPALAPRT